MRSIRMMSVFSVLIYGLVMDLIVLALLATVYIFLWVYMILDSEEIIK